MTQVVTSAVSHEAPESLPQVIELHDEQEEAFLRGMHMQALNFDAEFDTAYSDVEFEDVKVFNTVSSQSHQQPEWLANLNLKQLALTLESVLQRTQNLPLVAYVLKFILNTGAIKHIISKKSYFSSLQKYNEKVS